jgi:hypothetical protein
VKGEPLNVLQWWQANKETYPRLAQVAKDILAIPIAEVGVERVFNLARDVIGDRRHRLAAQTIRRIMLIKHAILEEPQFQESVPFGPDEQDPIDEIDDLLALPSNPVLEDDTPPVYIESSDDEPRTPSRRQQPPRKRVKPSRYQNK